MTANINIPSIDLESQSNYGYQPDVSIDNDVPTMVAESPMDKLRYAVASTTTLELDLTNNNLL